MAGLPGLVNAQDLAADTDPGILHVPVLVCCPGIVTICTGRLQSGERVGVGFTSQASLAAAYGPGHAWALLHVRLLRALLDSKGITTVLLDPVITWVNPGK
jgi:hypothetical protein